jgi:hypothetical protein
LYVYVYTCVQVPSWMSGSTLGGEACTPSRSTLTPSPPCHTDINWYAIWQCMCMLACLPTSSVVHFIVHSHTHTHSHLLKQTYTHTHMHMHTHTHTHTQMHILTPTYAHTHTHKRTRTYSPFTGCVAVHSYSGERSIGLRAVHYGHLCISMR